METQIPDSVWRLSRHAPPLPSLAPPLRAAPSGVKLAVDVTMDGTEGTAGPDPVSGASDSFQVQAPSLACQCVLPPLCLPRPPHSL